MAKRILIIEDNPINMQLFNDLLETEGYSILQAANGKDGLEIAKSKIPDLIVLDPGLPDIGRIEVIRALKENPITKDITLVGCTASVMKEERQMMIDAGCDVVLAKPIDTREFPKTIARFLRKLKKGGRSGGVENAKRQEEDTGS